MSPRLLSLLLFALISSPAFAQPELEIRQGECLGDVDVDHTTTVEVRDCIVWLEHHGILTNCCLEYAPELRVDGNVLRVRDVDVGPPCDCICPFDLSLGIVGLEPGDYTVEWDALGLREPLAIRVTIPESCGGVPEISAPQVWSHMGIAGVEVPVLAAHPGGVEAFSFGVEFPIQHCRIAAIDLERTVTEEVGAELIVVDIGTDVAVPRVGPVDPGWATCSVVLDAEEPFEEQTLPAGTDQRIARLVYDILPPGASVPRSISVPFVDDLGSERVHVLFQIGGEMIRPDRRSGQIQIRMPQPSFLRGDARVDQEIDISDAVFLLNHLFNGGPPSECEDAADADDSGELDLTDAIRILQYLFLGGTIPPPTGRPGPDPTMDPLDCVRGV